MDCKFVLLILFLITSTLAAPKKAEQPEPVHAAQEEIVPQQEEEVHPQEEEVHQQEEEVPQQQEEEVPQQEEEVPQQEEEVHQQQEEPTEPVVEDPTEHVVEDPTEPSVQEIPIETETEEAIPIVEPVVEDEKTHDTNEDDYKKGSICAYCKYCKKCDEKVCEERCPCKEGDEEEICEKCKYCKYCHACGTVCDTVCNPGGFLDSFTASIYEALPTFTDKTKKDVDEDIEKAKDFIKEYL